MSNAHHGRLRLRYDPEASPFWVCTAPAGEFNSPRPSRDGSVGINTRALGASVRVGRSTTTRKHPSHHVKDTGFERCRIPRNCAQLLRITVCNPRRNCTRQYGGMSHIAYAIHPRGQVVRKAGGLSSAACGHRPLAGSLDGVQRSSRESFALPNDPEALSLYLYRINTVPYFFVRVRATVVVC